MSFNDAMAQSTNIIVKIAGNDQIRRWTAKADQMTFAALQQRVTETFKTPKFSITYKDDEGDDITLGCDDELVDAVALALKSEPAVLRLKLTDLRKAKLADPSEPSNPKSNAPPGGQPVTDAAPPAAPPRAGPKAAAPPPAAAPSPPPRGPPAAAPPPDPSFFFENLAKKLPELVGRLPPHLQSLVKECELDIAASAAATKAASVASNSYNSARGAASAGYNAGFNATTQAAGTGLDAAMRAVQTAASIASHASDAANAAAASAAHAAVAADPRLEGFHPGVVCDKTNSPIVGTRYNLIGHDYDLCKSEYNKLPADLKLLYKAIPPRVFRRKAAGGWKKGGQGWKDVHPGVTCDKTGNVIVGMRYHLPGHDYDLCEAEYEKLPEEEKQRFKAIPPPGAQGGGWRRGPGSGRCGGWGAPRDPAMRDFGMRDNGMRDPRRSLQPFHYGPDAPPDAPPSEAKPEKPNKPAARFISDVSIHEGTQMMPKTKFTKIWRIKNSGEVPWWPRSKLAFVGGDQLSAEPWAPLPSGAPIQPGQEVDVAVEMVAPEDPGRYVSYWRLTGPMGRRKFGQRMWVHMQVVADPNEPVQIPSDEELSSLSTAMKLQREMGDAEDEADEGEGNYPTAPSATTPAAPAKDAAGKAKDTTAGDQAKIEVSSEAVRKSTPAPELSVERMVPAERASKAAGSSNAATEPVKATEPSKPIDPFPFAVTPPAAEPTESPAEIRKAAIEGLAMAGFIDQDLVSTVVDKHTSADGRIDLDKCINELSALADLEWDEMLDDLAEMGFEPSDRELHKKLLIQNSGSINMTVKSLVKLANMPRKLD
jgi:hypothetical protein